MSASDTKTFLRFHIEFRKKQVSKWIVLDLSRHATARIQLSPAGGVAKQPLPQQLFFGFGSF